MNHKPIDDGGPAFPVSVPSGDYVPGMSLRDYMAGRALAGIIASERDYRASDWDVSWWADMAYRTADAMLAARKGKP